MTPEEAIEKYDELSNYNLPVVKMIDNGTLDGDKVNQALRYLGYRAPTGRVIEEIVRRGRTTFADLEVYDQFWSDKYDSKDRYMKVSNKRAIWVDDAGEGISTRSIQKSVRRFQDPDEVERARD